MTKQEVLFLFANLGRLANIRHSKLAYAVVKNEKKLERERKDIIAQLEKMRGETELEKFVDTEEGRAILAEESAIELYKLTEMPDVELTAIELNVLNYITNDADDGTPDGPPVKK